MQFRSIILFALLVPLIVCSETQARAEKRAALVIGNGAYRHVTPLLNPQNDANDIAASLGRLNFSVDKVIDGTFDDMRRALLQFSRKSAGADIAVIFYSGHGMEINGENWLIPVDAELQSDRDAENEAIALKSLMLQAANGSRLGLVILDACRNNPFAAKMERGVRHRSVDRGLVRVEPSDNVLVAYAAREGTVASDGAGEHSPFTAALLNNLETPGLEILFLFRAVRDEVMAATKHEQQPFVYGSLSKQAVYLKEPQMVQDAAPSNQSVLLEARQAWAVVRSTTSPAVLEDFIALFGNTLYGSMARARLEELTKTQVVSLETTQSTSWAETSAKPDTGVKLAVAGPPLSPVSLCGSTRTVSVSLSSRAPKPLSTAEECSLKPGDVFKECDRCPEMTVVEAGSFIMGSPDSETDRGKNEGPQHEVTIAQSFAIGRFEVTRDEFDAFVADSGYKVGDRCYTFEGGVPQERSNRSFLNPGFGQTGNHPVVCVNWTDAKAYVSWLSRTASKSYRLPSESEWEYAARAGNTSRYGFGNDASQVCEYANGADQSAKLAKLPSDYTYMSCTDGHAYTAPVGSLEANRWGLFDSLGNVWEATEDCYADDYSASPTDGAPLRLPDCNGSPVRGGSWFSDAQSLRPTVRARATHDERHDDLGFRVVRILAQ